MALSNLQLAPEEIYLVILTSNQDVALADRFRTELLANLGGSYGRIDLHVERIAIDGVEPAAVSSTMRQGKASITILLHSADTMSILINKEKALLNELVAFSLPYRQVRQVRLRPALSYEDIPYIDEGLAELTTASIAKRDMIMMSITSTLTATINSWLTKEGCDDWLPTSSCIELPLPLKESTCVKCGHDNRKTFKLCTNCKLAPVEERGKRIFLITSPGVQVDAEAIRSVQLQFHQWSSSQIIATSEDLSKQEILNSCAEADIIMLLINPSLVVHLLTDRRDILDMIREKGYESKCAWIMLHACHMIGLARAGFIFTQSATSFRGVDEFGYNVGIALRRLP